MLPVLMYHGLHADVGAHGRFDPVYSVAPGAFAAQLDWLAANGFQAVRLHEAEASLRAGRKPVVITFDDGDVSNHEVALPLLRERGMHAEFFITSDFINQDGMLRAGQVRELAAAGMGIGGHGQTHRFLEDLPAPALRDELQNSRQRLQDASGVAVDALALPGGRGGGRERALALELGYRYLLGSAPGPNRRPMQGRWLQRHAVTRGLSLEAFAAQVAWRGLSPRLAQARFLALKLPKKVLGNQAYERLRERLL